jgi:peptide/nickel transport system permease protein
MTDLEPRIEPADPVPTVAEDATPQAPPQSPWRVFWKQFRKSQLAVAGGATLLVLYALALFAPFVAPYSEEHMDRDRFYHPPMRLHWIHEGRFHLVPFVHPTRLVDAARFRYEEDRGRIVPLRLFVTGTPYRLFGVIPTRLHLFGVDPPARVHLLGTDPSGRDVLARVLFGGQVSLTVGLIGIVISFTLGLLLGGISGYFGGWVDNAIMRVTELLLTIPSLYLLIALRAVFPVDLPSQQVYLAIVVILAFIGWAGLARIIRGMVLSIRRQEFVAAAEALGMGRLRIIARHILPNTLSFVIGAATITIPGYILGEVVLSFIGLGVQEPAASWGNMLAQARSIRVLTSFHWMLIVPGIAIFVTVLAFNFFGDGLRDALDPRRILGGKTA